jgi:hypothetical protein
MPRETAAFCTYGCSSTTTMVSQIYHTPQHCLVRACMFGSKVTRTLDDAVAVVLRLLSGHRARSSCSCHSAFWLLGGVPCRIAKVTLLLLKRCVLTFTLPRSAGGTAITPPGTRMTTRPTRATSVLWRASCGRRIMPQRTRLDSGVFSGNCYTSTSLPHGMLPSASLVSSTSLPQGVLPSASLISGTGTRTASSASPSAVRSPSALIEN